MGSVSASDGCYSLDTWVNFKVWGGMGLFMLAAVGTVASVARYLPEQS